MRLWHKDLIPYLPRQQLLAQWRECCCIARNIAVKGTPNHILVNRILDYPLSHFVNYTLLVYHEMVHRQYKVQWSRFMQHFPLYYPESVMKRGEIFFDWHGSRYLRQCYYNLQEKADCGAIPPDEWERIELEWRKEIHYEPEKHGRWEINCDGYYPYCSNCKNEPQGREMTLYCPNCGARMDGDSNDQS